MMDINIKIKIKNRKPPPEKVTFRREGTNTGTVNSGPDSGLSSAEFEQFRAGVAARARGRPPKAHRRPANRAGTRLSSTTFALKYSLFVPIPTNKTGERIVNKVYEDESVQPNEPGISRGSDGNTYHHRQGLLDPADDRNRTEWRLRGHRIERHVQRCRHQLESDLPMVLRFVARERDAVHEQQPGNNRREEIRRGELLGHCDQ